MHSASSFLYNRYVAGNREREEEFEAVSLNAGVARRIFAVHTKAGLAQQELASRVGTTTSTICLLDDADYEGDSHAMLRLIIRRCSQPA